MRIYDVPIYAHLCHLCTHLCIYAYITGALAKGPSYVPSKHGTRIYFSVSNIDETLAKVESMGSKILSPKTPAGNNGHVAEYEDYEGNCIALHSS